MHAQDSSPPVESPHDADLALAHAVASGDARAFETLMRRHNRLLYRTARSILKDDVEAEDTLQNAYLLAYREIGRYRGEARLSTWLTRIVINEALGALRRRSRSTRVELDAAALEQTLDVPETHGHVERPDESASRAELRRTLEACIEALPLPYRTVFMLRAVEELSVTETAEALGVPEATVRTRFFRARERLRERLCAEGVPARAYPFAGSRCDGIVARVLALIVRTPAPCLPA